MWEQSCGKTACSLPVFQPLVVSITDESTDTERSGRMAVTTTVPVLTDRQATTAVGPGTYARIHPHTRTLKHKHAHVVVVVNVRSFIPRLRFFFLKWRFGCAH